MVGSSLWETQSISQRCMQYTSWRRYSHSLSRVRAQRPIQGGMLGIPLCFHAECISERRMECTQWHPCLNSVQEDMVDSPLWETQSVSQQGMECTSGPPCSPPLSPL